ncbi:MAG: DLW-39 family protein [Nocardioidaceae bacterium]
MKKLLLLALAGVAGYLALNKIKSQQATQDLWSEATDGVSPTR